MNQLPGYLSQAEVADLLGPVRDFRFCIADMMSLQHIWNLVQTPESDRTLRSFMLGNSMGSGGGLLYGNSSISVGLCELNDQTMSHAIVQRRKYIHRLQQVFMSGKRIAASRNWLALSRDSQPVSSRFWTILDRYTGISNVECARAWIAVWQSGPAELDLARVASELADALLDED